MQIKKIRYTIYNKNNLTFYKDDGIFTHSLDECKLYDNENDVFDELNKFDEPNGYSVLELEIEITIRF